MSDLISRQSVIDVLKETGIIQDNDLGHLVVDEISKIPTAYDVDKVVAKLEKKRDKLSEEGCCLSAKQINDAIEIVKTGGNA